MIYCPGCGTANRDGSRFCNECGTKLPTTTSSLCPTCGIANPPHSLFCEKCGTRLIALLTDEPEEPAVLTSSVPLRKGLSLPTKPAADEAAPVQPVTEATPPASAPQEQLDWMNILQSVSAESPESGPQTPAAPPEHQLPTKETPDWLSGLGATQQPQAEPVPGPDDDLPEWARRLRTTSAAPLSEAAAEEQVPDWLKDLGITAELASSTEFPPAFEAESAAPLAPVPPESEEPPEWLQGVASASEPSLGTGLGTPEAKAKIIPPAPEPQLSAQEDLPDWLRDLRPAASPKDDLPDWLDDLASEAEEELAQSAGTEAEPERADSALEWLSQLADTGPSEEEQSAPVSEEAPDWLSALRATPPLSETESPTGEEAVPDWLTQPAEAAEESTLPISEEVPDWLSGLRAATPEFTEAAEPASAEELPDWLRELHTEELKGSEFQPADITPAAEEPAEQGVPDWLAGLGLAAAGAAAVEKSQEEAEPEQPAVMPEEIETPDWLSTLQAESPQATEPPPAEEPVPDWLSAAGPAPEPIAQEPADWLSALRSAAPEMEETPIEEQPDWMTSLREAAPVETAEEEAAIEGVPDWLSEVGGASEPSEEPVASAEIPAWLQDLGAAPETGIGQPSEEPAAITGEEETSAEGVPDWLKGLGLAAGAAALAPSPDQQEEAAVPDWLSQLGPSQPPIEEPIGSGDWLSTLRTAAPELDQQPAEAEEPDWLRETPTGEAAIGEPQGEVPDWLKEYGAAEAEITPAVETPTTLPADEGVPDWLKGIGMVAGAAAMAQGPAEPEQREEEVPDWLRDLGEQPAPAFQAAEVPDWLSETEQPPELTVEPEIPEWLRGPEGQARPAAGMFVEEQEPGAEPETPDWLRDLVPIGAAAAMAAGAEQAKEPAAEEIAKKEAPKEVEEPAKESRDWIKTAAPVAAAGVAAAGLATRKAKEEETPAVPAELPDWLQQLRREQAETPAQPTLIQAEIPAWLEALRPTEVEEAGAPAEIEAEKEGPLAGLTNVLPQASIMGQMQGTPVDLHYEISADDQARAGVLKELMARPASALRKTESFVVKSGPLRRRALRWIIMALFLTVILMTPDIDLNEWVFRPLTGVNWLPKQELLEVPSATQLAAAQVGTLSAGTPVLVVFDYDAGQSDEMNRIAATFLSHLLARGARIEAASLNPQGAGLAQSVWQQVSAGQASESFTNLGFIPGQAAGIQSVINHSNPVIVIELAASADTVRWWAEQITLSAPKTPLVVGISSAAEMLTLPYVKSGQVQGLVVGVSGALAYANQAQLSFKPLNQFELEALALASWMMGLFVAIALIMALMTHLRRRSAK